MDELLFIGAIVNGRGGHAELGLPGRSSLDDATDDWPERLCPGSLNVRVDVYPDEFAERGLPNTVKVLDTAGFEPALVIPQHRMEGNRLVPTEASPLRGTAQVWRAVLAVNGHEVACWMLRRIGSGLGRELEIVSTDHLRDRYGLNTDRDWPAAVRLAGTWVAF